MTIPGMRSRERERRGSVTSCPLLIVIGTIANLATAFSVNATFQVQGATLPGLASWLVPVALLAVLLSLGGAYGTWLWEKWGVYALAGTIALATLLTILEGQVNLGVILVWIAGGLLWFALRNKMVLFQ